MVAKAKAKREVCKKILGEAKQSLDQDIEETNKLIEQNNQILSKKARYVSDGSSFSSSYY
jgi:peptidoglycan hydrolase CwlO-like protein